MPISLDSVIDAIEAIAPRSGAAEWDNTGLLIAPPKTKTIARILLTIDLTHAVVEEAVAAGVQLIIAYHPPIFRPLKRIAGLPAELLAHGIAVYSPHTALDDVPHGVNAWLGSLFPHHQMMPLDPMTGQGRFLRLEQAHSLADLVQRVGRALNLKYLRIAAAEKHKRPRPVIQTVGICAGAGGAILMPAVGRCDLLLTGEMRHHDLLAARAAHTSVILTEHSNSERGYLPQLRAALAEKLGPSIKIHISECDHDPLELALPGPETENVVNEPH